MTLKNRPNLQNVPAPRTKLGDEIREALRGNAHFIAGSGARDNLYDGCAVYRTYDAAVDALAATFTLGRSRRAQLAKQGFLELPEGVGSDYCEIVSCACAQPWQHDDNMTQQEWEHSKERYVVRTGEAGSVLFDTWYNKPAVELGTFPDGPYAQQLADELNRGER